MSLFTDFRFALRSLGRVKGLTITVVATLALGIGANAAIFSVVRGVFCGHWPIGEEDRLIYIRQSAGGIRAEENANFSVPEIQDLRGSREIGDGIRRVLDRRVHARRAWRAARRAGRGGRWMPISK